MHRGRGEVVCRGRGEGHRGRGAWGMEVGVGRRRHTETGVGWAQPPELGQLRDRKKLPVSLPGKMGVSSY